MKYLKFEKDTSNRWYLILPEWKGDKSDLEMVCGADAMLDVRKLNLDDNANK